MVFRGLLEVFGWWRVAVVRRLKKNKIKKNNCHEPMLFQHLVFLLKDFNKYLWKHDIENKVQESYIPSLHFFCQACGLLHHLQLCILICVLENTARIPPSSIISMMLGGSMISVHPQLKASALSDFPAHSLCSQPVHSLHWTHSRYPASGCSSLEIVPQVQT